MIRIFSEEHRRKLREARKRQVSWIKGKKQTPQHIQNRMQSRFRNGTTQKVTASRGSNHYLWIEDRSKIKQYWTERNNPEYKQWRYAVTTRDKFQCRASDENCNGKIVAHHILPWSKFPQLRYEKINGITLCQFHHPRNRNDEQRLIPTFQTLVGSN